MMSLSSHWLDPIETETLDRNRKLIVNQNMAEMKEILV